jgi:hypothetical protein
MTGRVLYRVQCKFTSEPRSQIDLRRIHSNSSGWVDKRVSPNAYDWLYALRADGSEYLLKECHAGGEP